MVPKIVQEVLDWLMGKRKRRAYYGKVVWPKPESPSESRRRSSSSELWFDIDEANQVKEDTVEQGTTSSCDEFNVKEDSDAGQIIGDSSEELLADKIDDYRELPDSTDKTLGKKKEAGTHIVSFMIEGNSESPGQQSPSMESSLQTAGAMSSDQASPGISISAFSTGEETSGSTRAKIDSKIPAVPADHRTYEEGEMGDEYYIARNDSESIVVRQMHPKCRVMIPADYDTAVNEIKTCPLDCPYKALQFAEIDQKTLRSR